jgi:hypothetical protein
LLCFGVPSRRGCPPPSAATRPAPPVLEWSPAVARRRRCGAVLLLPTSPLLPLPLSFPLSPLSAVEPRKGGKPQVVGGEPAGGSGLGCRHPVKAAQGQRCCGAWGFDARAERRRGRASMAGGAPVGVAPEGKGVLPLGGFPRQARACSSLASGPAGRCGHPVRRAQARPGVYTPAWKRKKVRGRR